MYVAAERKAQTEYRAAINPVLRPDAAPMSFDDRARDRQPHAHALILGREERLEDLPQAMGRNARTGIGDRDFGGTILLSYPAVDPTLSCRLVGERVNAVYDQVENDLLQLNLVSCDTQRLW